MFQHIALTGKIGAGKDTVAGRLVNAHGFTQLAFADALREAALKVDPWITYGDEGAAFEGISAMRLSFVVDRLGWDIAKREYPEVRRLLQTIGQGVRDRDPDFWIRQLTERIPAGMPVVVSDVRYRNEALTLISRGFRLVRIVRPDAPPSGDHQSETDLDQFVPDLIIRNGGSLAELYERVDALVA